MAESHGSFTDLLRSVVPFHLPPPGSLSEAIPVRPLPAGVVIDELPLLRSAAGGVEVAFARVFRRDMNKLLEADRLRQLIALGPALVAEMSPRFSRETATIGRR